MAYLEVLGCLGGGFEVSFVVAFPLVLLNVKGLGGRGAEGAYWFKQILSSDVELKDIFSGLWNFATHTRFQVQRVLFWVRVAADLRLGDLNNHICYKFSELFGCKSEGLIGFWLRESVLAYYWGVWLLIVDHMLSERLLFVFRTPFVRSNMWSVTICTCGFSWFSTRASFTWMILSTDQTLLFGSTSFMLGTSFLKEVKHLAPTPYTMSTYVSVNSNWVHPPGNPGGLAQKNCPGVGIWLYWKLPGGREFHKGRDFVKIQNETFCLCIGFISDKYRVSKNC